MSSLIVLIPRVMCGCLSASSSNSSSKAAHSGYASLASGQSHSLQARDFSVHPFFERNSQSSQQGCLLPLEHRPLFILQGLNFFRIASASCQSLSYTAAISSNCCTVIGFLLPIQSMNSLFFLSITSHPLKKVAGQPNWSHPPPHILFSDVDVH